MLTVLRRTLVALGWRGFNSDRLLSLPLAAAVAQLPTATGVASNNAALAYRLTSKEPVVPVPTRGHYSAQSQTDEDARQLFELTYIGEVSSWPILTQLPTG